MWEPVQIRHRSAYYDAFFAEALMDFLDSGLAPPARRTASRGIVGQLIDFCLTTSRERVPSLHDGATSTSSPRSRRRRIRASAASSGRSRAISALDLYVPDCDTTACSLVGGDAVRLAGRNPRSADDGFLCRLSGRQQPMPRRRACAINDNIDYDGGIVTWIESRDGDRPFGNDLDPTLNLDVLEVSFRNHARWQIVDIRNGWRRLRQIVRFQARLAASGAFADPRSHIYYLPELYCAYFGRCYAAFRALPAVAQSAIDPDGSFELIRRHVLAYVSDDLLAREMNPFDAALALLALAKLGADTRLFAPPLDCIVRTSARAGAAAATRPTSGTR